MSAAPEQFIQIVVAHPSTHVVGVRFQKLGKLYHFDYADFPDVRNGDYVIVETVRGQQIGQIMGFVEREDNKRAYKPILRPATPRDLLIKQQLQSKEVAALIDCRELASQIGGFEEVKFVAAEYSFDGTNAAFRTPEKTTSQYRISSNRPTRCRPYFGRAGCMWWPALLQHLPNRI